MKRIITSLFIIILMLSGCKTTDSIRENTISDIITEMSFEINSDFAAAGKDFIVYVNTNNDPGFLTMALTIEYDSKAIELTKITNGKDYSDYSFVASKNLQSGCRVSWFSTGLPDKIKDGELMKLYFHVFEDTVPGDYIITISPISDGGIVDSNKNTIYVADCISNINIE